MVATGVIVVTPGRGLSRRRRKENRGTRVHIRSMIVTGALLGWTAAVAHGVAQTPAQTPATPPPATEKPGQAPAPPAPRVRPEAYPSRPPADPAVVARGKTLYS